ncbi:hypothetical protein J3T81_06935 [Staphylococcus simiae]|uniref:tail tube TT1 domain-containing protein n=1 Tax=Staphylococcus simiae TaxID=308354 RepID=UPI001A958F91|nr:phage tail protein [Staphylococcus simiae]MBO1199123.1 hypothetical protein [Staphylococcus simiae]MBO1210845.1 hypothetical protein [Staphylococcus simiae]QSY53082.1 hypothetical protein J3R86_07330 [Staphylococcus simiae]
MIKVINYEGKAFILPVSTTLTEKLNSDSELRFEFYATDQLKDVAQSIAAKWIVTHVGGATDEHQYVVTIVQRDSNAATTKVSVVAKAKQLDDLKSEIIYNNISGSLTGREYFSAIFKHSRYQYALETKVHAQKWQNAGEGTTVLENFKNGLDRYHLEFKYNPSNKTFYLFDRVEHYADYFIKNGTNALNFKLEEDGNNFYTYIKGFADFPDNSKLKDANIKLEYEHPLANMIGRYSAPPIKDGRIKDKHVLLNKMKNVVDQSLKQSLAIDFTLMQQHFKHAVAQVGDVVPVKDTSMNIFEKIRIIEVKTVRDEQNTIVKQDITLGNYKKKDRYRAQINSTISKTNELYNDKRSNQNSASDNKTINNNVTAATKALTFDSNGIQSVNHLNHVFFTQNGIEISHDGGINKQVAISGSGINTAVIALATQNQDGLMSKDDKTKLDNLSGVGSSGLGSIFYKEVT